MSRTELYVRHNVLLGVSRASVIIGSWPYNNRIKAAWDRAGERKLVTATTEPFRFAPDRLPIHDGGHLVRLHPINGRELPTWCADHSDRADVSKRL